MCLPSGSFAHVLSLTAVVLGKLRRGTALPQVIDAVCQGQSTSVRDAAQDLAYRVT